MHKISCMYVLWCIGVSELVVLGDEVETRIGYYYRCVCEWHPKPGPGDGSRLFYWDPRPSYSSWLFGCVLTRLVALLEGVCGCSGT